MEIDLNLAQSLKTEQGWLMNEKLQKCSPQNKVQLTVPCRVPPLSDRYPWSCDHPAPRPGYPSAYQLPGFVEIGK